MAKLFEVFPELENEKIIIRKMTEKDVDALSEITSNDNVYRYIPHFLYKKSRKELLTAIDNLGARDFEKQKLIMPGIYLREDPTKLVGLAEMFDYKKRENKITIGYRLNENYWHQGIATNAIKLMVKYLSVDMGVDTLQAFVIPENQYSGRALLRNGFVKEDYTVQEENWGGQAVVETEVYTYKRKIN